MTKRTNVRIISYIVTLLAILIVSVLINIRDVNSYKNQLELNYQQSLTELSECLDVINTDLTKTLYSNSSGEIYDLSRDLYAQCATAKNAISRLPVSQMELENAYRFLSQSSDYAQYVGGKIEAGEEITANEHKNLYVLLGYAQKFSDAASDMVKIVEAGGKITNGEVSNTKEINVSALSNSFSVSATTFEDFPTLLYDGPFSDQVLNKKSQLVSKAPVTDKESALKIAAKALGVNSDKVSYSEDEQSKIPCYTFQCARYIVSVTKQGGYIKSIIYSGNISESSITEDNAVSLAREYLSAIGYKNMEPCYKVTDNNICTVCFAYCENGVYYYSDLIKCGISLEDGSIASLDASTYLTNHTDREKFDAKLTAEQCKTKVSKYLTVNSIKKCVIPKSSGAEVQCYEFACTSKETGEDALIYINAQNANEEEIKLMLYTDNGTLVK